MGVYLGSNAVDMQGGFVTGGASGAVLQSKTVSPSESAQTIKADNGYDGLSQVTVNAVSKTYAGSSSGGSSGNNNVEAYHVTSTSPSVNFKTSSGTIKIWGYGTMTSQSSWGQQTTSLIAFAGDKYYKSALYGSPSSTSLSLSISNGKLSGLPSGLTAISAIVTRGI